MARRNSLRRRSKDVLSAAATIGFFESLEARRLLTTTTVNGTSAADTIVVDWSGSSYSVSVNGSAVNGGPTGGGTLFVNGLGGNDSMVVRRVHSGGVVVVDPGAGVNSTIIANGRFDTDLDSNVEVKQTAAEKLDTIEINDSASTSSAHTLMRINNGYISENTGSGGSDGSVIFPADIHAITLDRSNQDDDTYVDVPSPNLTVNLGNGTNHVYYGGTGQIIKGQIDGMRVNGGIDQDYVTFDDTNGGVLFQTYNITPTSIMNQTLNAFEIATIDLRVATSNQNNNITVSAIPVSTSLTINGGANNTTHIGTASMPIDLNHQAGLLTLAETGTHFMDVQETGVAPFVEPSFEFDPAAPNGVAVRHAGDAGPFNVYFTLSANLTLTTGTTNDFFYVVTLPTSANIVIHGGAGDDKLVNGGSLEDFEAAFKGTLTYDGGNGSDSVYLDDQKGVTGAGHTDYRLTSSGLTKGGKTLTWAAATVEHVSLGTTDQSDNIYVQNAANQDYFIDGHGGNDFFSNVDPATSHGSFSAVGTFTCIGDVGVDTLQIDDTANQQVAQYDVTRYASADTLVSGTIGTTAHLVYSDVENVNVAENNAATSTHVRGKVPAANLAIIGGTGNNYMWAGDGDLDSSGLINVTLDGNGGNDTIRFLDTLDNYDPAESESYNLYLNRMAKGSGSGANVNFFEFNAELLDVSNVNDSQIRSNTVTIYDIAAGVNVSVNGGVRIDHVNVALGTIDDLHATSANPLTLNLQAEDDTTINDYLSTDDRTYSINPTQFTCSTGFTCNDPNGAGASLTLNAGDGSDAIAVPSDTSAITINGNAGNDAITLGSGNVAANLPQPVSVIGGAGANTVTFDDSLDASPSTQSLASGAFTIGTVTHTTTLSNVTILAGPGGDTLAIKKVASLTTRFTGNTGDDRVTIGNGNLDANFTGGAITVSGGSGNDTLLLDDHVDTGDDTYTFGTGALSSTAFRKGTTGSPPTVSFSGIESTTLSANPGNDHIQVAGTAAQLVLAGNDGIDTFDVNVTPGSFGGSISPNVSIDGGRALDIVNVNTAPTSTGGTANVTFGSSQDLANLTIAPRGKVVLTSNGNRLLNVSAISIIGAGLLDLNDNDLRATATSRVTIQNYIKAAYHFGDWLGTSGIFSSSARDNPTGNTMLGLLSGAEYLDNNGASTFDGATVGATDALVKYTYFGDVDFNGAVDSSDYNIIDFGFLTHATGWANGDVDYSGSSPDSSDYNLIDFAFVSQSSTL